MTQMNLPVKHRLIDIENRLVVARAGGGRRGLGWEFGISRCKLIFRMDKQQGPPV